MHGSVNGFGFMAHHLHDINFTALWPPTKSLICRKHPDGGPDSLPLRQFCPYFNPSETPVAFIFRNDSGGGVVTALMIFFMSRNGQKTIFQKDILFSFGVVLQLVISPPAKVLAYITAITQLIAPLIHIKFIPAKFILPDQLPGFFFFRFFGVGLNGRHIGCYRLLRAARGEQEEK